MIIDTRARRKYREFQTAKALEQVAAMEPKPKKPLCFVKNDFVANTWYSRSTSNDIKKLPPKKETLKIGIKNMSDTFLPRIGISNIF